MKVDGLRNKLKKMEKTLDKKHPLRKPLVTALRPIYKADYKIGLRQIRFILQTKNLTTLEIYKMIEIELS